jgi:glycine/D-amino acid oxidase-like deaminating enzyme
VELVPKPGSCASPWDEHSPGILGSPYVAPLGVSRLLVGATKEYGAGVSDARRAGLVHEWRLDAAAKEAAHALVADASVTYPPLKGMEVDAVRYGVRANPPRTPAGSLPLVGRIEGIGGDGDGDWDGDGDGNAGRRSWWFVGGLGARGLVYHAMLGAIVAEAVMRGDPSGIPAELRFDPRVVST